MSPGYFAASGMAPTSPPAARNRSSSDLAKRARIAGVLARELEQLAHGVTAPLQATDDPLRFIIGAGDRSGEGARFLRAPAGDIDALNVYGYVYVKRDVYRFPIKTARGHGGGLSARIAVTTRRRVPHDGGGSPMAAGYSLPFTRWRWM